MAQTLADKAVVVKRQKMSVWEIITLLPGVLKLALVWFRAVIRASFRDTNDKTLPRTRLLYVGYTILRQAPLIFSTLQLQFLQKNAEQLYNECVKKNNQAQVTVDLGHGGAKGYWLGSPKAKNVLVYYHGGGFALPPNDGYFVFLYKMVQEMKTAGKDFAVFLITYTLTPHATYPTQLIQAVAALHYILLDTTTQRSPANIFLGGDSAGANLTINVLAHLSHPHPAIKESLSIGTSLGGAFLIAPWTDLRTEFDPNEFPDVFKEPLGDIVNAKAALPWATAYVAGAPRDYYTDPMTAPISWWDDLPVKEVLVVGGGNEILLPLIEEFVKKLTAGFPNTTFFIGEREGHVAPIFNLHVGDRIETEQGKKVKSWLREMVA